MGRFNKKMRITQEDLRSAAILINYANADNAVTDVISVPVEGLTPADMVRLSACNQEDLYNVLFSTNVSFYAPISMSTMLTHNYNDIDWDSENDKVNDISSKGDVSRVCMNISYAKSGVYTLDFPSPSEAEIRHLYGLD